MSKFLFWAPRILAILFIVFLSIFAIDVFWEYSTATEIAIALFMHLIPSLLLVVALIISWKNDLVGAISFGILTVASLIFFNALREWMTFVIISLPTLVVAVLFLAKWLHLRSRSEI